MSIELVVAHYAEDLAWLRNVPPAARAVVYDKSAAHRTPGATLLPNSGREAGTYLHHICSHYEGLAPLTVFCQGKPFDHAFDFKKTLRELAAAPDSVSGFRWLGHIIDTDSRDGALFKIWSKNPDGGGLALDDFHRALWGEAGPSEYVFRLGAQFVAPRAVIWARPRAFYERALRIALEFPEAAHCFERTWDRVFGVAGVDLEWLGERRVVYLKPVKRIADATRAP